MINYDIKTINNNKILYLYLDYNYEFANLGKIKNNKNLIEHIKNYIKNTKIKFNGKYIVVMIAGIMIVTLTTSLKYNEVKKEFEPDYEIVDIAKNPNIFIENTYKSNKEDIVKEIFKDDLKTSKIEEIKNNEIYNIKTEDAVSKEQKNTSTKIEKQQITNKIHEENKINKTFVVIYRSNGLIETIELEEYLIGVVAAEMPASFNIEALKAQAIVARTYALKRLEENKTLTDTVSTQVYKDNSQLKDMWGKDYNKYYTKIKKAVTETKDLIITYDNKLIDAVFHSTSNGYTVDAKDVWGNDIPYLKSVISKWDLEASSYLRKITKEIFEIEQKLGIIISDNEDIKITSIDNNNRVIEVNIAGNLYTGIELRNKLSLRSTDFEIEINGNEITFTTKGYGHGVGMSQYGANGMANNGYNYKQIINHYYKNVQIKNKN